MFVAYCTVCKKVMGWGDNDDSLKSTLHSSGEFENVAKLDSEGNPILNINEEPIKERREITHECSTFELESLPENVSSEEMVSYLETNYADNMI